MLKAVRISLRWVYAYFSQFRGFERDVEFLLLACFFASVVMGLTNIIVSLYLSNLGFDSIVVGAMVGEPAIISLLVIIHAGIIADRYSRKKVLILSVFTYALAFAIYATCRAFLLLLLASALIGISWGTYLGPLNAMLTDKSKLKERNYVFGLYSFLSSFAFIIGSLLAGATDIISSALRQTSLEVSRTMFWISVGLTLISLLPLLFIHESIVKKHNSRMLTIRSWKLISNFSAVNGLIGFGAGVFIPLLPLYLSSKFSATDAEIGVLFAVSNAVMGVANLFAPRLSEKIGPVATITLTQALSVVPLAIIPSSNIFYWVGLLYILRTGLINMASPILNTYTMSMVSQDERASASGIINMVWNGANAVSTVVSGILMGIHLDLSIYVGSLFYILSTILSYTWFRGLRQNPSE